VNFLAMVQFASMRLWLWVYESTAEFESEAASRGPGGRLSVGIAKSMGPTGEVRRRYVK